ncbi:MAG: PEGA domain-containing protein [Myxococcales bacterium]|nr:PEGA domain-containing protein [Myxococcales bacterium]
MKRTALIGLALVASACGGGVVQRVGDLPPPPPDAGLIQIVCDPPDADVYIDGHYRGQLGGYREGVIRLPRGHRRLSLQKPGFYAWYGELDAADTTLRFEVRLVREVR